MLFILVMDAMAAVFSMAETAGLFEQLAEWGVRHRLLLYVDDVVLLIKPLVTEAEAVLRLLRLFGEAFGLFCNLSKSSISPIRCDSIDLAPVMQILQWPVRSFLIIYLGLPLSLMALTMAEL